MRRSFPVFGYFLITGFLFFQNRIHAQSYVDPFQIRYTYGFRNPSSSGTPFNHLWVGSDLPIKLKDRTYQLFSPFYESWSIDSAKIHQIVPRVQSIAFPIGFILPTKNPKWTISILPVVRWNAEKLFTKNSFQFGGAGFATLAVKPKKNLRFGVYMNTEFFGLFVIPLVGADWRIDDRNYVFGLLPGRFTWEHKWQNNLYGGLTFRSITNSYRLENGNFLRLQDNQISAYLDYYPTKHFCLTLEPGYGGFRKIDIGKQGKNYLSERNWGDGLFFKLSSSYRIRL